MKFVTRILISTTVLALCAPLAGCPKPKADAVAINAAGVIAAEVLNNDGHADWANDAITVSSQLATAITNFVPGSSAQNIVQLGNAFAGILRKDTNSKGAEEVGIVLQEILAVVEEYQSMPTTFEAAANATINARATRPDFQPQTKQQLYAAYNAALKAHPVTGLKPK